MKKLLIALLFCMSMQTVHPLDQIMRTHRKKATALLTLFVIGAQYFFLTGPAPEQFKDDFEALVIVKTALAATGVAVWAIGLHNIWCPHQYRR